MPKIKTCEINSSKYYPSVPNKYDIKRVDLVDECDKDTEAISFVYQDLKELPDLNGFYKLRELEINGGKVGTIDGSRFKNVREFILTAGTRELVQKMTNMHSFNRLELVEIASCDLTGVILNGLKKLPARTRLRFDGTSIPDCLDGSIFYEGDVKDFIKCQGIS